MPRLTWERKSDRVEVAFVTCTREDIGGKMFRSQEALRVIKESDGYRVDKTSAVAGAWLPWEPVTRETYRHVNAAKSAARAYATKCQRRRLR